MPRRTAPRRLLGALSRDQGSTLVETLAGLAVLSVVLGIFALFMLPLANGVVRLQQQVKTSAGIAQVQLVFLKIEQGLKLAPWWPADQAIEASPTRITVKDLGYRHTTREDPRPPLLELSLAEGTLLVQWGSAQWRFNLDPRSKLSLLKGQGGAPDSLELSIPDPRADYRLSLTLPAWRSLDAAP